MDNIDELLTRRVEAIYPTKESLEKVLRSGKKLKLYQGFDPTGTVLHIGHMVGLMKMRQFQDLGHHVIFLVGDGTGQAGDPSGKLTARDRFLTKEELRQNAKDYVMQAGKIVRFDGPNKAEILYNSDWLNKLNLVDLLNLFGKFTIQQLIERDMFQKRLKENKPINLREFVYPLLQGYDSVAMGVDLEMGGNDQTFNMLTGRTLVREMLKKEKYVLTVPLLTDKEGRKIGKTEGNVIALTAPPRELFGMMMTLPDDVIGKGFEYITNLPMSEVKKISESLNKGENPMILKKKLAFEVTKILNDETAAKDAREYFEQIFQKRSLPTEVQEVTIAAKFITATEILIQAGLATSNSQAKTLIRGGAMEIDGNKINDPFKQIEIKSGQVVKLGKHKFVKIRI